MNYINYSNNPYNTPQLGTSSVQGFIRTFAFIITFLITFGFIFLLLGGLFLNTEFILIPAAFIAIIIASIISKMFYVVPEYAAIVLLRLGKFDSVKGSGMIIVPPFIYSVERLLDLRITLHQVEATDTLTEDNVPTKVTAAIEYRIEDPKKAVMNVTDYQASITWLSTEALKNTIGSLELKDLLSEREKIAESLRTQMDEESKEYGIDIRAVRITDINTPPTLVEELAVIARAKRAAQAKRIQAEAEIEVAQKIKEASDVLGNTNNGIRLRELQILSEMSKEESSMIIIYPYGDRSGQEIANGMSSKNQL